MRGAPVPVADLLVDLYFPSAALVVPGLGRLDGLLQALGQDPDAVLGPLLRAPRHTVQSPAGHRGAYEKCPLRLTGGRGFSIPLGPAGELGVLAGREGLEVDVPGLVSPWVIQSLTLAIGRGEVRGPIRPPGAPLFGSKRFVFLPTPGRTYRVGTEQVHVLVGWG